MADEPEIVLNGDRRRLTRAQTVAELVDELSLPDRGVAIEIDGEIIPRSRWDATQIEDGNRIEVVQMVGGG